jgi:hypothetical protein
MPVRTGRPPARALPHRPELTLPDGRTLAAGQEFSIHGGGRFVFSHEHTPDGSATAWGPIGSKAIEAGASWRSFKPSQIKTIHRSTTERSK